MKSQKSKFRHLSSKDIELITKLCERIHRINHNESFSNHAYVVLRFALSNTYFAVDHYNLSPLIYEESLSDGLSAEILSIYAHYVHQHPFATLFRMPGQTKVSTVLTTISVDEFHRKELYNEFYRKLLIEDQLAMGLQWGTDACVIAYSRDRPFTEREQTIMQIVQPHVQIAWDNWRRIRELEGRLRFMEEKSVVSEETAQQARDAKRLMNHLSPRERDIAELVAQGMENRKIAETLHISPKTVGKHLENIFTTLNLHHRAALAAKWRQSGPAD